MSRVPQEGDMVRIVRSPMLDAMFPTLVGVAWRVGPVSSVDDGGHSCEVPGYPHNAIVPELLEVVERSE